VFRVASNRTNTQIESLNTAVSQVVSGLQEEIHLLRSELRMVRTVVDEHKKSSLENEKQRNEEQQLFAHRYEDFTTKLLTILGSSERLSNHVPWNVNGSVLPANVAYPITPATALTARTTQIANNQPIPFETNNRLNTQIIPTLTGASNTESNIPLLRAVGVTAFDALVPCNRPHIPILEKQFPCTFREIYDEYQRLNLYRFEKCGSKSSFTSQQQSLFQKRYRAMRIIRTLAGKHKPPKPLLEIVTNLDEELRVSNLTMTNFLNQKYDLHGDHKKRKR
jgi:hypothetical protein